MILITLLPLAYAGKICLHTLGNCQFLVSRDMLLKLAVLLQFFNSFLLFLAVGSCGRFFFV